MDKDNHYRVTWSDGSIEYIYSMRQPYSIIKYPGLLVYVDPMVRAVLRANGKFHVVGVERLNETIPA